GAGLVALPRFFADRYSPPVKGNLDEQLRTSITSLNTTGFWPASLAQTSNPYKGPGGADKVAGDFAGTHVGDETDTSPFTPTTKIESISTAEYLRNMNILVHWLAKAPH
ncbi:MAG TPA: hypothetical protein VIV63_17620, partial [Steroidobacteraceae bacterium]